MQNEIKKLRKEVAKLLTNQVINAYFNIVSTKPKESKLDSVMSDWTFFVSHNSTLTI